MIDEGKYPREIAFEFQIKMARLESNSGVSIHCKKFTTGKERLLEKMPARFVCP